MRLDVAVGRGPAARRAAWTSAAPLRLLRGDAGVPAADARADRRRDARPRRPARLRAHAADARAAHPAREGDVEHLHRAGAERARRDRLPGVARAPGGSWSWASCCSRARSTRARRSRAWTAWSSLYSGPGRARVRAAPRRRRRGRAPALRRARGQPRRDLHALSGREQDRGGLLVAITERRTRADIDRLAEVLGAAIAARALGRGIVARAHRRAGGADERSRRSRRASRRSHLRARRARAPGVRVPGARRARGEARRGAPARSSCATRRRGCPRSPSRRSCATTCGSRSATSTSTPASTRSARAR